MSGGLTQAHHNPIAPDVQVAANAASQAYAPGRCIGGLLTFDTPCIMTGEKGPVHQLDHALFTDLDGQSPGLDLVLFDVSPAVVPGDNVAWTPAAADLKKVVCRVKVKPADWDVYGTGAAGQPALASIETRKRLRSGGKSLYGLLIFTGSQAGGNLTWGDANALTIRLFGSTV